MLAAREEHAPYPATEPSSCNNAQKKGSFFRAHNQIFIALYEDRQAKSMAQHILKSNHITVPIASVCRYDHDIDNREIILAPTALVDIYKFDDIARQIARRNADCKLVFSAGCNVQTQIRAVFLIGCHLILSHGLDVDQTLGIFRRFEEFFADPGNSHVKLFDCWRALHRASCVSWIDFRERFDLDLHQGQTINMEELIHYSRWACSLDELIIAPFQSQNTVYIHHTSSKSVMTGLAARSTARSTS